MKEVLKGLLTTQTRNADPDDQDWACEDGDWVGDDSHCDIDLFSSSDEE